MSNEVPALAWFLLASLVPLALGITAPASVLLGDYAKAQMLAERLSEALPHHVHEEIVQLILRTRRDSPLLIVGSIAAMLWTSSGAVGVLERSVLRLIGAAWLHRADRMHLRWGVLGAERGPGLMAVGAGRRTRRRRAAPGDRDRSRLLLALRGRQYPVELFLMLTGVLITCYLAALALLIGAGVTMRVRLGHSIGDPPA